ncbi:hypothetical protein GCM10009663_47260 [Kitasatospora arboriphila]|uniref:Uncharacterized protein n=1 Tax=Kitasatospora arboriphila TaxID=258052 RepID=A0ABN1TTZ5_9ACTN
MAVVQMSLTRWYGPGPGALRPVATSEGTVSTAVAHTADATRTPPTPHSNPLRAPPPFGRPEPETPGAAPPVPVAAPAPRMPPGPTAPPGAVTPPGAAVPTAPPKPL